MSESFILPTITAVPVLTAILPAAEIRGDSEADFTVDLLGEEEIPTAATTPDIGEGQLAPRDMLEMLMEELSGVSGGMPERLEVPEDAFVTQQAQYHSSEIASLVDDPRLAIPSAHNAAAIEALPVLAASSAGPPLPPPAGDARFVLRALSGPGRLPAEAPVPARKTTLTADATAPTPRQIEHELQSAEMIQSGDAAPRGGPSPERLMATPVEHTPAAFMEQGRSVQGTADEAIAIKATPLLADITAETAATVPNDTTAQITSRAHWEGLPTLAPAASPALPELGQADLGLGGLEPPPAEMSQQQSMPASRALVETFPEFRPVKIVPLAISRQIADAVVTSQNDRIEVALAPEELGRIRLVMSGGDHNPHVVVWAERPEVLDQLRRNTAILQECFGDAGLADASFEFQEDTSSDSRSNHFPANAGEFETYETTDLLPVVTAWSSLAIPARLDIRI